MAPQLTQLLLTIGWTFIGVLLIYGGTWLFEVIAPVNYRSEIRRGNVAAGLGVAAEVVAVLVS